jgi:hypothetical protein
MMKGEVPMFRFAEGDTVALTEDHPSLGLSTGDVGVIWALYNTTPPAYDVTFCDTDGRKFDMVVEEDDLTVPSITRDLASASPSLA